jgi:hypothetical protein
LPQQKAELRQMARDDKYQFDLKSDTLDPTTGEVIPIGDRDQVYLDKKTKEFLIQTCPPFSNPFFKSVKLMRQESG